MKNKVLIIPSWYPTSSNQVIGSFFKEQALLLEADCDFLVLYGQKQKVNIFKFMLNVIFGKCKYIEIDKPPEGVGFYFNQIRNHKALRPFWPIIDKINLRCMVRQYSKIFHRLTKGDWTPDLIHAHSVFDGGIVAKELSICLKRPYVITEHQPFLLSFFLNTSEIKQKLVFSAYEDAGEVLVVSEHMKRQILMNGVDCSPVVVGNFTNENIFRPLKIDQKDQMFKILTVTYDSYLKDNETLFKAISMLIDRNINNIKLTIIGSNSNSKCKLYQLCVQYGIKDYVAFIPYVKREDMPVYYNGCDLFVTTSISESFGVAQSEAMFCGKPVVATSNGGIDDIMMPSNGIKVPIQDYEGLASAILRVKNKEIVFDEQEIRNSVVAKYGREAFLKKMLDVYNKIMT